MFSSVEIVFVKKNLLYTMKELSILIKQNHKMNFKLVLNQVFMVDVRYLMR